MKRMHSAIFALVKELNVNLTNKSIKAVCE